MALFEKKSVTLENEKLPVGIILMTGLFFLSIVFSVCYGNKDYMKIWMTGEDWNHNILLRTSFLTGGLGLFVILDYGIRYSFKKENKIVPWAYFALSILEAIFVIVNIAIYFNAYMDVKKGAEWSFRIITAIYICLLLALNIISRLPKFLDFSMILPGDKHHTAYLTLGSLLSFGALLMILTVVLRKSMPSSLFFVVFLMVLNLLIGVSPFVMGFFVEKKKQLNIIAFLASVFLFVIAFAAIFIFHSFFSQVKDKIEYREFYWAAFSFGYSALVWLVLAGYYSYIYKANKF